jgi:uncharacterized membrane protein
MTQQNAALVQQSAAATESLKEQAQRLARAVRVFRLEAGRTRANQGIDTITSVATPGSIHGLLFESIQPAAVSILAARPGSYRR